jgi:2-polyprenyl-6-methoxyphenol hydroxylase-like FAD-dependent oxidoreductase
MAVASLRVFRLAQLHLGAGSEYNWNMTRALAVGAGIGGLATAVALSLVDVEPVLFERVADLARVEVGAGITLWPNAVLVLDRLGLGAEVRARGAILNGFEQRTQRGRLLARWPLAEMTRRLGAPVVGVNRPDLHAALAAAGSDCVQPGSQVTDFEDDEVGVGVTLSDGRVESGDVLIGADGINSFVRTRLLGDQPPRFAGLTMWRASVTLDEAAMPAVDFLLFWGAGAKFVCFRSGPARLSWEAIVASDPGGHDPPGESKRAVLNHFADFTDPVLPIIEATSDASIFRTDVFDRPPDERWGSGRVTLLGDAAHPMTFAVGQGAAQALEDALAIADALDGATDAEGALRAYEQLRMRRSARFQTFAWRLARAGAWRNPGARGLRSAFLRLSVPVAWRTQVKDMTIAV